MHELLYFAADDRLGELGVMARHVGVRMAENLSQYVDQHRTKEPFSRLLFCCPFGAKRRKSTVYHSFEKVRPKTFDGNGKYSVANLQVAKRW